MTNLEALKKLYVEFGGTASDVADMTTSSELIEALSTLAASAGIELPKVTAEDDGDVLTVVDGKWNKAAASGGAEKFVINVTMDGESYDVEADKTYAEVVAAYAAGKQLFVNFSTNSADVPMRIRICSNIQLSHVYGADNSDFVFSYTNIGDGYVDFGEILFQNIPNDDGNVVYHFETVYIGG